MIAEAIDAACRIGWALAAWLFVGAFVATFVTLTVCAGVAWAVERAWRGVRGPSWRRGRLRARFFVRRRVRASTGRVWLPWARVPPSGSGTTGPSRPHVHRWSASQGPGGAFPARDLPEPSEASSEDPIREEAA